MWSFLKRLLDGPPAPEDPLREIVGFDDAGFTRTGELARAMGLQTFWPWSEIHEFGFRYTQALFPDPWAGDYMESLWFVRVPSDGGGLMTMDFDASVLDIDHLPPALLRNLPGLDLDVLRAGLAAAARGRRHDQAEGEWVGWRRAASTPPQAEPATPGPGPA